LTRAREAEALLRHAGAPPEEVLGGLWSLGPEGGGGAGAGPRFLMPFVAWDPDESHILREVARLGLIGRGRCSPLMTNNALIPVIGISEVLRHGHTCFELEFARMIREGKSERTYWLHLFEMLEYSAKTGRFVGKTVAGTLEALGLTRRDLGLLP
jgi:hypothetical protein